MTHFRISERFHSPRAALLLALFTLGVSRADAGWTGDSSAPEAFVVGVTAKPSALDLAADGEGGAIVVWQDTRNNATTGNDIYAQRVNGNGDRQWGDVGVPVAVIDHNQLNPAVISDGAGGAFVAWYDQRLDNTNASSTSVYAQHLDANGQTLWAANGIEIDNHAKYLSYLHNKVALCADGAGGIYVLAHDTSVNDFRLHRIAADGARPAGWESPLTIAGGGGYVADLQPKAAAGAAGPFDVWVLGTLTGIPGGLHIVPVGADQVIGTPVDITSHSFNNLAPAAVDEEGALWVASGDNFSVYANRIKPDGTLAWPDAAAQFDSTGGAAHTFTVVFGIVPAGNGSAILLWDHRTTMPTDTGSILALKISADGQPVWDPAGITMLSVSQPVDGRHAAIRDGAGGAIALIATDALPGFVSQRINASGTVLWGASGTTVETGTSPANSHGALVSDASNGALSAFTGDSSTANPAFGGQLVTLTGALGSSSSTSRLVNISCRAQVGSGDNVLIPGFFIAGGSSTLLIRGIGPALGNYGIASPLADPKLELFDSKNQSVATNDDWSSAANATQIASVSSQVGAFALPNGSKDAAMLVTLPTGLYTAVTSSANGGSGVGLVELYEVNGGAGTGRLVNMSVRAQVGTGDNVLIPGIYVGGTGPRSLLVRAVGPTLAGYGVHGVLADPQITLYKGNVAVGSNDDWSTPNGTQIAATAAKVGAFPLSAGSKDAALLVTVSPGSYTALVSGVGGVTGVCLVEVYEAPQ